MAIGVICWTPLQNGNFTTTKRPTSANGTDLRRFPCERNATKFGKKWIWPHDGPPWWWKTAEGIGYGWKTSIRRKHFTTIEPTKRRNGKNHSVRGNTKESGCRGWGLIRLFLLWFFCCGSFVSFLAFSFRPGYDAQHDEEEFHLNKVQEIGWLTKLDPSSGRNYYFNESTGESRWDKPKEMKTTHELMHDEENRRTRR